MVDMVNRPPHYATHPSGVEAIQITRVMCFDMGNAFKYLWRHPNKNGGIEDLLKSKWYLDDWQAHPRNASFNLHDIRAADDLVIKALHYEPIRAKAEALRAIWNAYCTQHTFLLDPAYRYIDDQIAQP